MAMTKTVDFLAFCSAGLFDAEQDVVGRETPASKYRVRLRDGNQNGITAIDPRTTGAA